MSNSDLNFCQRVIILKGIAQVTHIAHTFTFQKNPFFSIYCKFIPFQYHLFIIIKLYHFKTIYCQQLPIYRCIIVKFHHIFVQPHDQLTKMMTANTQYLHKTSTFLFNFLLLANQPIITMLNVHNYCTFLTFQDPFVTFINLQWHSH